MAGKVRYLLNRNGRYFARLVVPADLRKILGDKTELRTPLGPDYRTALKLLPGAVAELQHQIGQAERKAHPQTAIRHVARYPLMPKEIAAVNYAERLSFDELIRNTDPRYANMGIDDQFAERLRDARSGKLDDDELRQLIGRRIERYRTLGNTSAEYGTPEWRELAIAISLSEYEALARTAERNDGDWAGQPALPHLTTPPVETMELPPVKLRRLFADYIASRSLVGKGTEANRRWLPVIDSLIKHIGHDDAQKLTKADLRGWRDALMTKLAPKTVSDVYLASVRTILQWAVTNDRLEINVAANVRQEVPKKVRNREKGYTLTEATHILAAAKVYVPPVHDFAHVQEAPLTIAAKRWTSLLCAFSGARVVEITQLRKQDFRDESGVYVMRISPDAGTVKTGLYRDVPVHSQLIDMGFRDFVDQSDGPLFYIAQTGRSPVRAARTVAAYVGKWMHANDLTVASVAPNHGWRHRFKTVGREAGIQDRVLDALTGHASTTAGDAYGDVTIATKAKAIAKLPNYDL